ncbi:MAG: right-handed parallel beta-helix repeat-containing protein [Gemmatimonadota bacterium]
MTYPFPSPSLPRPTLVWLACATLLAACGGEGGDDSPPSSGEEAEVADAPTRRTVPGDFSSIQAALDSAAPGDTILVAPGVWTGSLSMPPVAVTLASTVAVGADSSVVAETVLDGGGGDWVIRFDSAAAQSRILGLTVRNAVDCIYPHAPFDFVGGIITDCEDGIDYQAGSGGRLAHSRIIENRDDGVDLDGDLVVLVEHNLIRDNGEDGIEAHFQPYRGALKRTVIRENVIRGNGEDGIQFIGGTEPTDREVLVEGNRIYENGMAAVGCMDGGETSEDYRAAVMQDVLVFVRNEFEDNGRGLTCGYLTTARRSPDT